MFMHLFRIVAADLNSIACYLQQTTFTLFLLLPPIHPFLPYSLPFLYPYLYPVPLTLPFISTPTTLHQCGNINTRLFRRLLFICLFLLLVRQFSLFISQSFTAAIVAASCSVILFINKFLLSSPLLQVSINLSHT